MICAIQRLSLLCTLLLLLVGTSSAFQHQKPSLSCSWGTTLLPTASIVEPPGCRYTQRTTQTESSSTTALDAINTNKNNNKKNKASSSSSSGVAKEPKQEKEKVGGIGLLILYMTPWKNPNSIFVYMLLTLYFLGKYSEARSLAAASIGL
jgi:hypothetical protein